MKLIKVLIVSALLAASIYLIVINTGLSKKGFIILITGPSSSGKTTLSRNVQKFFAHEKIPFLYLSGDTLVSNFPAQYVSINQIYTNNFDTVPTSRPEGLVFTKELKTPKEINTEKNEPTHYYSEPLPYKIVIEEGILIKNLITAVPGLLAALSDQGINIILDMGTPGQYVKKALTRYPLSLIAITTPTSTLEEREDKNPTTRIKGLARERNKLNFTEGADFIIPNNTSEKDWAENFAPNEIVDWVLNHHASHFPRAKD